MGYVTDDRYDTHKRARKETYDDGIFIDEMEELRAFRYERCTPERVEAMQKRLSDTPLSEAHPVT